MPAPMASAPVSPMKMRAGAAFHHRNPAHAPTMAAAMTARSRAWLTWYVSKWRKAQKPIAMRQENARVAEPAARPSSPSVRFTPLVVA